MAWKFTFFLQEIILLPQVARFLHGTGDASSALKLLVTCSCTEEAFQMAKQTGEMALLGQLLADEDATSLDEMRQVAKHFESEQDAFLAGKFYHLAGDELKAVQLLLKAAAVGHKEALEVAVQAAAASDDIQLSDQVIQFICGDVDGVPKVINNFKINRFYTETVFAIRTLRLSSSYIWLEANTMKQDRWLC